MKLSNFPISNWTIIHHTLIDKQTNRKIVALEKCFCTFLLLFVLFYLCITSAVANCRQESRYGYENCETGNIQWEYPVPDIESASPSPSTEAPVVGDDEMDICTTPPPNEFPDELPPAPPAWSTEGEPLPPGIDNIVGYKVIEVIRFSMPQI